MGNLSTLRCPECYGEGAHAGGVRCPLCRGAGIVPKRVKALPQTMFGALLTEAQADAIYSVLVDEAGAREADRSAFISTATDPKRGLSEWRFGGGLGVGGKIHYGPLGGFYVTAYSEDLTDGRNAIITRTNKLLWGVALEWSSR
jgi:hypothetical protein